VDITFTYLKADGAYYISDSSYGYYIYTFDSRHWILYLYIRYFVDITFTYLIVCGYYIYISDSSLWILHLNI